MTDIRLELQSPLTLLQRWQGRPDGAKLLELLVTGYTLDLTFVEQRVVSLARGLGARATILGDANHGLHNPVDIRHAGRSYQHANIACRGAFHPKLVVLLGELDVWIAIGSGNPTTAGWGYNDELWIIIRSPRAVGPQALAQLGEWIAELAHHSSVQMPSWISATLSELADMITPDAVDESTTELQILGNLDRPLVEQLPVGPVTSLNLSAPFFDPKSAAVRALIERLRPTEVTVGLQPMLSSYDGETLTAATELARSSQFRHLSEDGHRIRHGKLIEWSADGTLTAMIGSPNLSRAALMVSTSAGGNCELAVIHPVLESLLPEGVSASQQDIRCCSTIPTVAKARESAGVTLLGARRIETGITVELITAIPATITVEVSTSAAPGEWWPRYQLEISPADVAEVVTAQFPAPESAGVAVRVVAQADGTRHVSSVVFLTDTARCRPRAGQSAAPRLPRDDYSHIFTDPELLARFEHDLLTLLRANAAHRATQVPATGTRPAAVDDTDRWGSWLQDLEITLGPSLTMALFPAALTLGLNKSRTSVWAVDTDDAETAEYDEDSVDLDGGLDDLSDRRQPPNLPAEQRRRRRQEAQRLARAVISTPPPSVELRMAVYLWHLDLLAGGVWGPDDDWIDEFAQVLTAMPPSEADDMPECGQPYVGALVAMGLALMSQTATLHGGRQQDLVFQRTWDAVGKWAAQAEPDLIDHYLYQPAQTYSRVTDRQDVDAVIELATAALDDPHALLLAALEAEGVDADYVDGLWVSDCGSAKPRGYAARVGTLIGQHVDSYALVVQGDSGSCLLLCDGSTLAIAESTTRIWRVFTKPTAVSTPSTMLSEGLPHGRTFPRRPGAEPPAEVLKLADAAGVGVAALVSELGV
jgi:hypothetical protein